MTASVRRYEERYERYAYEYSYISCAFLKDG